MEEAEVGMGRKTIFSLAFVTWLKLPNSENSSDYKRSIVPRVQIATFSLGLQSFSAYDEPNQFTFLNVCNG